MNERMFKDRTKGFALSVIRFVDGLPRGRSAEILGRQLLRSATSVGANYRAACRGRSRADVVAKLSLVEEEADESMYWMELLAEGGFTPHGEVSALMAEANELVAMIVASIKALRTRR